MARFAHMALLVGLALALASCSRPDSSPTPSAAAPVASVTSALPAATGLPTPPPTPPNSNFRVFTSEPGRFSIQYPAGWSVVEEAGLVEFASPEGDALARVLYAPLPAPLPNDQLADQALDTLRRRYGERLQEGARRLQ